MDKSFKEKFLKGSLASTIGQISSVSLHFGSMIIITRYMVKAEFGIFSLILATIVLLQLISGLGLDVTLAKQLAVKDELKKQEGFQKLLSIRVFTLFFISIIFFIISKMFVLVDSNVNNYIILITIIFSLSSLRDFFYAQLQGLKKFKEYALVQFVSALGKFLIYLTGWQLSILSLDFLVYAELIALVFSFITQQVLVPIKFKFIIKMKLSEVREIFKFSYPLYFNNLLALINNRANAFIISAFLGTISLASYQVANNIPGALTRVYNSFIVVFFPNVATLFSEDRRSEAYRFIEKSNLNINLMIIPFLILTYIFGDEITILFFSAKYIETSFALFLFMIVFYFRSVSSIAGYSLVALGKSLSSFNMNFFGVLFGFISSIILTPILGFEGAIYGIIISRIVSSFLGIYNLRKEQIKVGYISSLIPLIFCLPFIAIYDFLRFDGFYQKLLFLILFFIFELITFKDFRNTLIDVVKSIYRSLFLKN